MQNVLSSVDAQTVQEIYGLYGTRMFNTDFTLPRAKERRNFCSLQITSLIQRSSTFTGEAPSEVVKVLDTHYGSLDEYRKFSVTTEKNKRKLPSVIYMRT
jgi:hypothetical protein